MKNSNYLINSEGGFNQYSVLNIYDINDLIIFLNFLIWIYQKMNNVAIVGFGYWGPNIARNFYNHPTCELKYICDLNDNNLKRAEELYPDIESTPDFDKIINDDSINIVAIVTPVSTHFELAMRVLKSKNIIYFRKPMVQSSKEADTLISLAKSNNLVGVVDHTFLFYRSEKN